MKYTTESIITKFKSVHGFKYDYSKVEYGKNQLDKVIIICYEHGEFLQSPKDHLNGRGCKTCGYRKVSEFLNKGFEHYLNLCKEIHGDKYNYSLVENNYSTLHNRYKIICADHGIFEQTLSAHIHQKAGCPQCWQERQHGFKLNKWIENSKIRPENIPTLYLINIFNSSESFLKIGITYTSIESRFKKLKSSGYDYKVLSSISVVNKNARGIALIELELHLALQQYKYKPLNEFKGQGECYKIEFLKEILKQIRHEIDLMRYNLMMFEDLTQECYDIISEYELYLNVYSKKI